MALGSYIYLIASPGTPLIRKSEKSFQVQKLILIQTCVMVYGYVKT